MATEDPTEVQVTMLLCDAAQSVGGKLYILGGGFSQVTAGLWPGVMSLAVRVTVPWDQANEPLQVKASLVTDEGAPVEVEGNPVIADGVVEVGRPPGLRRGTALDTNLALTFNGLDLAPGGYVWEFSINEIVKARSPFDVNAG